MLKNTPCLKRILRVFGQGVEINLNGLTHRGKKQYTLESIGLIYLIFWIFIMSVNFKLIEPALNGEILKVGTDQQPLT